MILDKFTLTGKSGIVTGAGSGIGLGMARGLTQAGAEVIITGRDPVKIARAAEDLNGAGKGRALSHRIDLTHLDSIPPLVEMALVEFGKIDFLFNNAGMIFRTPCEDFPMDKWDEVLRLNLTAPFFLAQAVARTMIERGIKGCIVNTSSLIAVQGGKTVPAYAASKGGITQITKTMCNDWAKYGIRVNAIGPGWTATDLTRSLREDAGRYAEITSRIPIGRWAEPDDFGGVAVFLVSDASSYITGQVVFVDGGWLAM
jgi:NAD(P)-dependent dehydrogenase (short-subunit alcohol dehydrogenase family)